MSQVRRQVIGGQMVRQLLDHQGKVVDTRVIPLREDGGNLNGNGNGNEPGRHNWGSWNAARAGAGPAKSVDAGNFKHQESVKGPDKGEDFHTYAAPSGRKVTVFHNDDSGKTKVFEAPPSGSSAPVGHKTFDGSHDDAKAFLAQRYDIGHDRQSHISDAKPFGESVEVRRWVTALTEAADFEEGDEVKASGGDHDGETGKVEDVDGDTILVKFSDGETEEYDAGDLEAA